jgi:hypothetical protein
MIGEQTVAASGVTFVGQMEPQFAEPLQLSLAATCVPRGTGYFHRPKQRFHILDARGEGPAGPFRKCAGDGLDGFTCGTPREHFVRGMTRHEPERKIRIEIDPMPLSVNCNESSDRRV